MLIGWVLLSLLVRILRDEAACNTRHWYDWIEMMAVPKEELSTGIPSTLNFVPGLSFVSLREL